MKKVFKLTRLQREISSFRYGFARSLFFSWRLYPIFMYFVSFSFLGSCSSGRRDRSLPKLACLHFPAVHINSFAIMKKLRFKFKDMFVLLPQLFPFLRNSAKTNNETPRNSRKLPARANFPILTIFCCSGCFIVQEM